MRKYLFASSCFFCRNRRRGASVAFLFAFASLLFVTLYSAISGHTLSDSYTLIRYMEEKTYSPMQTVKRGFFAMRNGVIADTPRKGGSPFRIIFGLNLPQIVDIAAQTGTNPSLAEDLWHNTTTRESMLLAPMLVAPDAFSKADALRWIADIPTAEVADVLCHRLLRHLPFAWELAEELCDADMPFAAYTALRLAFNLVASNPSRAAAIAARFPERLLARSLAEEAAFFNQ